MCPSWMMGVGREPIIDGLGVDDLNDVLPMCVLAILAYINVAFSHAKASH
jgi:hypothetical protein